MRLAFIKTVRIGVKSLMLQKLRSGLAALQRFDGHGLQLEILRSCE